MWLASAVFVNRQLVVAVRTSYLMCRCGIAGKDVDFPQNEANVTHTCIYLLCSSNSTGCQDY